MGFDCKSFDKVISSIALEDGDFQGIHNGCLNEMLFFSPPPVDTPDLFPPQLDILVQLDSQCLLWLWLCVLHISQL